MRLAAQPVAPTTRVTLNPFALPTTYHAPQTAAELALDHVLNLDMTAAPENLSHLMATNTLPAQYAALFTPALSLAVFNANTAEVQQNCNGKPQTENGLICDLHFDVLLCEPDVPPTPILYRTISGNGNKATVAFEWGTEGTDHGRYRLVKVDGTWKLDGVNCIFPPPVGSITFNWHAGTVSDKFNVSQSVPQFAQFPSPAYRGPIGRVDLSSPNVYQYRTRLQNGARQPPNFAGHYQLVQWGCGTECNTGAVIDALNGQVTFLPTVAMQGMEAAMDAKFKAVEFRADSRLIVFSGRINETGVLGTHFDLWNGSGFQELLTVPFVPPATQAQQQPVGGGTLLSHKAASQEATSLPPGISPGLIQSWKDYIRDYPTKLAEYQKDQAAHRKEAKEIDFSEVKNMDDVEKSHPFLHEEFQKIRDDQKMEMAQDKTYSEDLSKIYIAESRGKINLLFVKSTGRFYCGSHGCNTTVYADEGTGYKKAMDAITGDSVYVTRTGGEVFLYLRPPNIIWSKTNALPVEFILKDHKFVENQPPPQEPDSPLYQKWRDFLAGGWFGGASTPAGAQADGHVRLRTNFTGADKCLDIINDGQDNKPTMAACGNFTGQMWTIAPNGTPGIFKLQTQFTGPGKCLDIINDGQDNKPTMAACGNFTGQMWSMSKF